MSVKGPGKLAARVRRAAPASTRRGRRGAGIRLAAEALIILLSVAMGGTVMWAQAPSVPSTAVAAAAAPEIDGTNVRLLVGRSTVVEVGTPISRVSLTSADIADAHVTSPSQLLVHGKMPGTISMFVWDRAGGLRRYDVAVQRDLVRLSQQLRDLFPGEQIQAESNGKNIVLSGMVSSKDVVERAVNVAAGYVDKKEEVTTLLQLSPNGPSNQVLLRVRFAEVSRSALTELGASFVANGFKDGRWFGRSATQQFPAPEWDQDGKLVFSDFLNLFLFDAENELATVIKALQTRGLFQSLAEPNLIAESGKEASFLAGGEIPIPIAQGSGANLGISVTFKEFGVRLSFTPTVSGNRINLKVRPEVSTLDFANAVVLDGFRIPALSTRRTETELELQDGQTFAIAGLVNNTVRSTLSKIPGIGDIPILGLLFTSKAAQKEATELVVMITPQILPNNSPGVTPNLPRSPERFLEPLPERRTQPPPPPAFSQAAPAADQRAAVTPAPIVRTETPAATAAAAVAALTPSAPRPIDMPVRAAADPVITPAPAAMTTMPATSAVTSTVVAPAPVSSAQAESPTSSSMPATAASPGPDAVAQPGIANQVAGDASSVTAFDPKRSLTRDEKKAIDQARRDEQERAKRAAEYAKREAEAQKRAQEAARKQADRDAKAAKESQKNAEASAKKQAERDREQQKLVDEAAARLRVAEESYYAEVAKQSNQ